MVGISPLSGTIADTVETSWWRGVAGTARGCAGMLLQTSKKSLTNT